MSNDNPMIIEMQRYKILLIKNKTEKKFLI